LYPNLKPNGITAEFSKELFGIRRKNNDTK
jgi:hypothetical protein